MNNYSQAESERLGYKAEYSHYKFNGKEKRQFQKDFRSAHQETHLTERRETLYLVEGR
jgi:hypothetical protein